MDPFNKMFLRDSYCWLRGSFRGRLQRGGEIAQTPRVRLKPFAIYIAHFPIAWFPKTPNLRSRPGQ
jgi:hypothetical protein